MARVSVEDCLEHCENRFALVVVASARARQIMNGEDPMIQSRNKEMVIALREIAEGYIVPDDTDLIAFNEQLAIEVAASEEAATAAKEAAAETLAAVATAAEEQPAENGEAEATEEPTEDTTTH